MARHKMPRLPHVNVGPHVRRRPVRMAPPAGPPPGPSLGPTEFDADQEQAMRAGRRGAMSGPPMAGAPAPAPQTAGDDELGGL